MLLVHCVGIMIAEAFRKKILVLAIECCTFQEWAIRVHTPAGMCISKILEKNVEAYERQQHQATWGSLSVA